MDEISNVGRLRVNSDLFIFLSSSYQTERGSVFVDFP